MEILIAAAITTMVVTAGSQLVFVGLVSNKVTGDKNTALGLAEELFIAVRAVSTENWNDVDALTHGTTDYQPQISNGKWILTSGSEDVILNGITYTRSFTIQNVCRDLSTKALKGLTDNEGGTTDCTAIANSRYDASTRKITVSVGWPEADPINETEYITRWRNKVCLQTAWNTTASTVADCPAAAYGSKTNITSGSSLQLCSGSC